ncbi:hypothetical protein PYCCODRAFT_408431 [Trametes coccinea BRFM310]|uniref:Fungal-type protein kinase domain-containing protein n=1 Tax=Trametes coccinea (strain BRFM310) TaxID=1353009 RepID=A0A1Y2IN24_TRAC3|nr:hypothetical protein PYCCODRAFT_408431 [Trametes coccinea BRFM310]
MPSSHAHDCVYDVPMALDPKLLHTRGLDPDGASLRMRGHLQDTVNYIVGPMLVQDFIDSFMPSLPLEERKKIMSSRAAFTGVPSSCATAAEIFEPMIAALNRSTKHKSRAPGLVFENASARSEYPHSLGFMKPHICCYTSEGAASVRRSPLSSRADLGYAELFIEVKPDMSLDYFVDPPLDADAEEIASHDFLAQHEDQRTKLRVDRSFGQHIAYVTEIFARQQRVCLYSVSMSGSHARLCRWDRSGLVITRSFDIRRYPELLCEFLARFACASSSVRGHDSTVNRATSEEEAAFLDAVTKCVQRQLCVEGEELVKAVQEHYAAGHVSVVQVHSADLGKARHATGIERYLISRPVTSPLSVVGRGTRGYWAVQADTGRVVFLKDTWRAPVEQEGCVIARLNTLGVRNVPVVLAHGDVYFEAPAVDKALSLKDVQISRTDCYDPKPWACPVNGKRISVSTHIHYRLVLGTVGYELQRFRGTDELLRATFDVFQAMRDTLAKDSRIHRDISTGNIILVREDGSSEGSARRGYLVDWESSSRVDEQGLSIDRDRTGTWRFMSIKLINEPDEPHTFQDDMEALFYVVLYCSLVHLQHDMDDPQDLRTFIQLFFDSSMFRFGRLEGGDSKRANAIMRTWTDRVKWNNADLKAWLDTVMDYHRPPMHLRAAWSDRWSNPDYLDSFWRSFLEERSLAKDDWVENKIAKPRRSRDSPDTSLVPFKPPARPEVDRADGAKPVKPSATPKSSRRRPRHDADSTPSRRSERLRLRAGQSMPGLVASGQPDDVRRTSSKRLRVR